MKETVILDLETYLQMRSDIDDLTNQVEYWRNKTKEEVEEAVLQECKEIFHEELFSKKQKIKELEEELYDLEGCLFETRKRKGMAVIYSYKFRGRG